MGLFRKGKTCIVAQCHGTDFVICSHSREGKTPSYSRRNMVGIIFRTIMRYFCFVSIKHKLLISHLIQSWFKWESQYMFRRQNKKEKKKREKETEILKYYHNSSNWRILIIKRKGMVEKAGSKRGKLPLLLPAFFTIPFYFSPPQPSLWKLIWLLCACFKTSAFGLFQFHFDLGWYPGHFSSKYRLSAICESCKRKVFNWCINNVYDIHLLEICVSIISQYVACSAIGDMCYS